MIDDYSKKCAQLPEKPGVYFFRNAQQKIIYVGKAKNLKKRVSQYFRKNISDIKTNALMQSAVDFHFTITENEVQALLLESNLIKEHHPKYNILLRDDKSYPYLFLSTDEDFPRLDFHRGEKRKKGRYFGPYPNAGSVRDNLAIIQKLFQLRQCSDSFFKARSRPCLQYQIARCTAPCVQYVSKAQYQEQVHDAIQFLEGKNKAVIQAIEKRMSIASRDQAYESAAQLRDLLIRLQQLKSQQFVTGGRWNIDVFSAVEEAGQWGVAVLTIRHGQLLGHKTFFPNVVDNISAGEVLTAFIAQYYLNPIHRLQPIDRVITTDVMTDRLWLQNALQTLFQHHVKILQGKNKAIREWQTIASTNAASDLQQRLLEKKRLHGQWEALQFALQLSNAPSRIECFDISHTAGESTKGSCVVFDDTGPLSREYRQFTVDNVTPGDDYAALSAVLTRRYTRLKMENKPLPDVIMVDGGKGQLNASARALEALQVSGVVLLAVAKGKARKPGKERLFIWGRDRAIQLSPDHAALHLIQWIRDEAHRFAITSHRKARDKKSLQSGF